ncbi:MAG: AAA family ATPase [Clostridia bacterium]|nr:AAA family ATPase [Clostridia bacterium]
MGKIIAVTNQKGGVGKTTTTVNLSACVAAGGKRVLVVDVDPQGNATSGFGAEVARNAITVYEVLIMGRDAEKALMRSQVRGLSLMPADIRLAGAELELVDLQSREHKLKQSLATLRDRYDYVFIDCPPSLGLLTLNALVAADSVLVPIQCEYYALEGVTALMNTIQLVKQQLNQALEVEGVVLTMLDARTNLGLQVVDEVKRHFKGKVFTSIIPRNVRLGEAPSHGLPIHLYDARSVGAEAYYDLARELLARN